MDLNVPSYKKFDCRVLFLTKRPNPRAWSISGWPSLQPKFDQLQGTFPLNSPAITHQYVKDKYPVVGPI